jgi:2-polyprenyl-3-methyl-5-hydroxy-6-metoxy-1,4-benzoquinol methylase
MNKQEFYSRDDTVERYEKRRFGGKSGHHVNERELHTVLGLLPPAGKLLDVPVGTGRLSLFLSQHGFDCHGIDYSESMLELARSRGLTQLSRADIFETALDKDSFCCAVSLRFFFHFRELRPVLQHVFDALEPGGVYVFDTYNRSPRAWLPFLGEQGRVYLHAPEEIERLARAVGFEVAQRLPCYVFSPLVYRFLPFPVVQTLDRVEQRLPGAWLARVFWKLQKPKL